jgi:hypothetical protein
VYRRCIPLRKQLRNAASAHSLVLNAGSPIRDAPPLS